MYLLLDVSLNPFICEYAIRIFALSLFTVNLCRRTAATAAL